MALMIFALSGCKEDPTPPAPIRVAPPKPLMTHMIPAPSKIPPPSTPPTVATPPVFLQLGTSAKGDPRDAVAYRLFRGVHSPLIGQFRRVSVRAEKLDHTAIVVQDHKPADVLLRFPAALKGKLSEGDQVEITVVGTTDTDEERTIYKGTVGLRPSPR